MRIVFLTICLFSSSLISCQRENKVGERSFPKIVTTQITQGEITKIINATGSVRPDITVKVGSEISGKILDIKVDFNSVVKTGDVLAVINPDKLENLVSQNQARVENRQSDIKINTASLARANINHSQAKRSLNRRQQLFAENAISKAQLEETERALQLAEADVTLAEARLEGARFALRQAEADLQTSRADLSRTTIRSPIDGIVIDRMVDPGQTVAASFSAPELFKIAANLSKVKIDAAIIESDVAGLNSGDHATFSIDAYPGKLFTGTVDQLRLKSENRNNIITYTGVISADNSEGLLMPGMTATLQITTHSKSNVLRMPASVERFRPTPEQIQKWQANLENKSLPDTTSKLRDHLMALNLQSEHLEQVLERIAQETETIQKDIRDPTKSWKSTDNKKRLSEIIDFVLKDELSTIDYQKYRQLVRAQSDIRDAVIWIKIGNKIQPKTIELGLSDGAFVEIVSGLEEGATVVTGLTDPALPATPRQ